MAGPRVTVDIKVKTDLKSILATKAALRALGKEGSRLNRMFRDLASGFMKFLKLIGKISFVGMAIDIGLVTIALVGVRMAMAVGRWAIRTYEAALRGLGVAAGIVAVGLGTMATAAREFAEVNLAPVIGGLRQARQIIRSGMSNDLLSFFGIQGIQGAVAELARGGVSASRGYTNILKQLGNFAPDAASLAQLAAVYAEVNRQGKVTEDVMARLIQMSPVFAAGVAEIAGKKGLTGVKAEDVALEFARAGKMSASEFARLFSGELAATDLWENQLENLNETLFGQLKGMLLRLGATFADVGQPFLEGMKDTFKVMEYLTRRTMVVLSGTLNRYGIGQMMPGLLSGYEKLLKWISRHIINATANIEGFTTRMRNMWWGIKDWFIDVARTWEPLIEGGRKLGKMLGPVFGEIFGKGGLGGLVRDFNRLIQSNWGDFQEHGEQLRRFVRGFIDIFRLGQQAFVDALPAINKFLGDVTEGFLPLMRDMIKLFKDAVISVLPTLGEAFRALADILRPVLSMLSELMNSGGGALGFSVLMAPWLLGLVGKGGRTAAATRAARMTNARGMMRRAGGPGIASGMLGGTIAGGMAGGAMGGWMMPLMMMMGGMGGGAAGSSRPFFQARQMQRIPGFVTTMTALGNLNAVMGKGIISPPGWTGGYGTRRYAAYQAAPGAMQNIGRMLPGAALMMGAGNIGGTGGSIANSFGMGLMLSGLAKPGTTWRGLGRTPAGAFGIGTAGWGAGGAVSGWARNQGLGAAGSVALGAGSGALAGFAMGGPIGAAIGGIAGLVSGIFGARHQDKLRKLAVEKAKETGDAFIRTIRETMSTGAGLEGIVVLREQMHDLLEDEAKLEEAAKAAGVDAAAYKLQMETELAEATNILNKKEERLTFVHEQLSLVLRKEVDEIKRLADVSGTDLSNSLKSLYESLVDLGEIDPALVTLKGMGPDIISGIYSAIFDQPQSAFQNLVGREGLETMQGVADEIVAGLAEGIPASSDQIRTILEGYLTRGQMVKGLEGSALFEYMEDVINELNEYFGRRGAEGVFDGMYVMEDAIKTYIDGNSDAMEAWRAAQRDEISTILTETGEFKYTGDQITTELEKRTADLFRQGLLDPEKLDNLVYEQTQASLAAHAEYVRGIVDPVIQEVARAGTELARTLWALSGLMGVDTSTPAKGFDQLLARTWVTTMGSRPYDPMAARDYVENINLRTLRGDTILPDEPGLAFVNLFNETLRTSFEPIDGASSGLVTDFERVTFPAERAATALSGFDTSVRNSDARLRALYGGLPGSPGDYRPGGDTASSRFSRTLGFHGSLSGLPGKRTITSGWRNWGLGSGMSDHLTGRAYDLTGQNLGSYASAVKGLGGFAEFHGHAGSRHLHVVAPIGDRSSPASVSGLNVPGIGNVNININGANASPEDIANRVITKIRRLQRQAQERS